uniref:Elongation of very long chain fatty acids protein n=1 Tax=Ascaris lumbricoides TaxID=6252 RepID=A0A0M3IGQ8_ASCLU
MSTGMTQLITLSDILFGEEWNVDRTIAFMALWVPTSFKITVAYLAMVYFGQKMMRNKAAFELDRLLAVWNFSFSIFSAIAAYRLIPELLWAFKNLGFVGSYCDNADFYKDPSTGYWGWLFVMSKAPELGDTLFLVLRKRPVIFMHWYHHALTFLYAQITYSEQQAWCRWSLALNLSVHAIMYFYFGVRALHFKTPRLVAQFITSIQIIQFVINCYIFAHLFYIKYTDSIPTCQVAMNIYSYFGVRALHFKTPRLVAQFITSIQIIQFVINCYIFAHLFYIKYTDSIPTCQVAWNVLTMGALMYLSYLYLFVEFFYNAYIVKKPRLSNTTIENEPLNDKKTFLPPKRKLHTDKSD